MMSNIPLLGSSRLLRTETDDGQVQLHEEDLEEEHDEDLEKTSSQLLDDVIEVLNQQQTRDSQLMLEEERLKIEEEEEKLRLRQGLISYQGYLEKKSPAHNLWQVITIYNIHILLNILIYEYCE